MTNTKSPIDEILNDSEMTDGEKVLFKNMVNIAKIYQKGTEKNFHNYLESAIEKEAHDETSSD